MATELKVDSVNGLNLNVLTETVNAIKKDPELGKCRFRARNKWIDGAYNCSEFTDFYGAKQKMVHKQKHELHADEPPILAGGDQAANPAEHLLNALASCVTTSMVAHAAVNGIHIEELESELEGDVDLNGFLGLNSEIPKGYTNIRVKVRVKTDPENLEQLKRFSEFSPIYHTIVDGTKVDIDIKSK